MVMGNRWWDDEDEKPPERHIEGWWTIGEAPNYEVNDDGEVRHKPSGRSVKQHLRSPGPYGVQVQLSANGKTIGRSVKSLVETGRKYQGVDDGKVEDGSRSSEIRSKRSLED